MCDLHDDWVNTQCFKLQKIFSMKGVLEHFPKIVHIVKENTWHTFTDEHESPTPIYFPENFRKPYTSYNIRNMKQKYK